MERIDWIKGDMFAIDMPTHPDSLRAAGTEWLTRAFRHIGALDQDNAVARITRFEDCPRGSTGRKLLLSVEYERPSPDLHGDLFVKFSRAFDDELRDRQRYEMQDEARFAALSRGSDFPIDVPACYFSDFHAETGTGIMITQCIPYGEGQNERHYEKCMDWEMPDPLGHYRAIIATNARLAAAHRAGRLPAKLDDYFAFDEEAAKKTDLIRYDAQKLRNRVSRYAEFATQNPQILPEHIREPAFFDKLMTDVPRFLEQEGAVMDWLYSRPDQIVFAHWNANVDNGWFWKDDAGAIHCGFIDWGRVGQMNVAQALWGSLSGAELDIWNDHLDELIALYIAEFEGHGGGEGFTLEGVRLQLEMLVAHLGICWLLDAVPLIRREIPDLEKVEDRFDARFRNSELARNQLHMLTVFMNLWQRHDLGARLDEVLAEAGASA